MEYNNQPREQTKVTRAFTRAEHRPHHIVNGFFLSLVFMVGLTFLSHSRAADPVSLDFADFKALPNGGVEIRLALSGNAPTPADFTSSNPPKVSLDLVNTSNNLPWSLPLPIEVGGVNSVMATETDGRTRIDIDMNELAPYRIRTSGSNIFIAISGTEPPKPATSGSPATQKPATVVASAPKAIVSPPQAVAAPASEPRTLAESSEIGRAHV